LRQRPPAGIAAGGLVPGGAPAALGEPQQYLVFSLCGEAFAIGIRSIKEIIEYGQLTEVPMMPDLVRGVINLRGAVVPVVDLAVRFGRAPTEVARRTCIVIIEIESQPGEAQVIGVIVDAVTEVLDIPPTRTSSRRLRSARASAAISSRAWARSAASSSSCSTWAMPCPSTNCRTSSAAWTMRRAARRRRSGWRADGCTTHHGYEFGISSR
jgi:chemotaxis signal transduction protein